MTNLQSSKREKEKTFFSASTPWLCNFGLTGLGAPGYFFDQEAGNRIQSSKNTGWLGYVTVAVLSGIHARADTEFHVATAWIQSLVCCPVTYPNDGCRPVQVIVSVHGRQVLNESCVDGSWSRAFSAVNGDEPAHAATLAIQDSYVPIPRDLQCSFIACLGIGTGLDEVGRRRGKVGIIAGGDEVRYIDEGIERLR